MARKKREEEKGIEGGWINTFADLMNLLLCFFVLLFSMSTVDADKYEQLVTSMSERINIFDGGGNSVGQGPFVTVGTKQVVSFLHQAVQMTIMKIPNRILNWGPSRSMRALRRRSKKKRRKSRKRKQKPFIRM